MRIPTSEELKHSNYQYNILLILENARKEAIKKCNRYIELNQANNEACSDRLHDLDIELNAIQNLLANISELNRKEAKA